MHCVRIFITSQVILAASCRLRIAVVADPTIKKDNFHTYSGDGFRQNIALCPGLINAAAAELTGVFEQVRVIDLPEQATAQEASCIRRITLWSHREPRSVEFPVYGYSLVLSIEDHGQNPVAQHKHSGEIRPSLTVAGWVAVFLTGVSWASFTYYASIISYSTGEQIREDLEDSLHETRFRSISYDMRNDPRLLAYGAHQTKV